MTEFEDRLRAIKKSKEEATQLNASLRSSQEEAEREQKAEVQDLVDLLAKQHLDPLISQIKVALTDGEGNVTSSGAEVYWTDHKGEEPRLEATAKRTVSWNVKRSERHGFGEDYYVVSSYDKVGLTINNFGEIEILIDNPFEESLHLRLELARPNIANVDWEEKIKRQVERVIELDLQHWHEGLANDGELSDRRNTALDTFKSEFQ